MTTPSTPAPLSAPKSDLLRELQVAEDAARAAAAKILEVRTRALADPSDKPNDMGPVTLADLAADKLIREALQDAFPDDLVITEETWEPGSVIESARRAWIVDPLDGTADFVAGGDDYAVMIGLCIGGIPRLGVVCQPPTAKLWRGIAVRDLEASGHAAQSGVQTMCESVDESGQVSTCNIAERPLPTPARFALSRNHKSPLADFITEQLNGKIVRKGSVGLKIAMILDDEADVYLSGSRRIKVWDTAGPAALLHAGGAELVTSLAGEALSWSGAAAHGEGIRAMVPSAGVAFADAFAQVVERYRRAKANGEKIVADGDDDDDDEAPSI